MHSLMLLVGFILGIVINAMADNLPHRRLPLPARCESCGGPRRAASWSGLVAFFVGARSCPYCGVRRSVRAPLVEVAAAAGAVLLYFQEPAPQVYWPSLFVGVVFLLIVVIDIEHRLILHAVTGPSALVVGILGAIDPHLGLTRTLLGGVAGFAIVLGLYLLGILFARALSRARGQPLDEVAFGFGDVTLAGLIGLAVGWPGVLVALLYGVLAGGLFSLVYIIVMAIRRRYTPFMPIPYGPFLILGASLIYYFGAAAIPVAHP